MRAAAVLLCALAASNARAQEGPVDLLENPRFKSLYIAALGPLSEHDWLLTLEGPAPENREVLPGLWKEQWRQGE